VKVPGIWTDVKGEIGRGRLLPRRIGLSRSRPPTTDFVRRRCGRRVYARVRVRVVLPLVIPCGKSGSQVRGQVGERICGARDWRNPFGVPAVRASGRGRAVKFPGIRPLGDSWDMVLSWSGDSPGRRHGRSSSGDRSHIFRPIFRRSFPGSTSGESTARALRVGHVPAVSVACHRLGRVPPSRSQPDRVSGEWYG